MEVALHVKEGTIANIYVNGELVSADEATQQLNDAIKNKERIDILILFLPLGHAYGNRYWVKLSLEPKTANIWKVTQERASRGYSVWLDIGETGEKNDGERYIREQTALKLIDSLFSREALEEIKSGYWFFEETRKDADFSLWASYFDEVYKLLQAFSSGKEGEPLIVEIYDDELVYQRVITDHELDNKEKGAILEALRELKDAYERDGYEFLIDIEKVERAKTVREVLLELSGFLIYQNLKPKKRKTEKVEKNVA